MTESQEKATATGRRGFLALSLGSALAVLFGAVRSNGQRESNSAIGEREARYYKPLFRRGRDLAG